MHNRSRWAPMLAAGALAVTLIASTAAAQAAPSPTTTAEPTATVPPVSTWAGTVEVPPLNTVVTESDGDLWPNCWADDDAIYTAWGDGKGFATDRFVDVGTAKITGDINNLKGTNTALSENVSSLWKTGTTRKPTGAVCVGNTIYLAIQDLTFTFTKAPAATIVKSTDGGKTWTWDKTKPMFDDAVFTTIWFADFGKGGEWNTTDYVYAYGLDGNWRMSMPPDDVPDPEDVFLARIPKTKVQDRGSWQFFSGYAKDGTTPRWSKKIADKKPVLTDTRKTYERIYPGGAGGGEGTVISQGGVVYNKPLNRYIYASWTDPTYHFYEAPNPWGPWKRFGDHDFTRHDDRTVQHGGYATTFPSKFISDDGLTMMLQSNRCCSAPIEEPSNNGATGYAFNLRPIKLQLTKDGLAMDDSGADVSQDPTTVATSKSSSQGVLTALNDGDPATAVDDWDGEVKLDSWWGYTWPQKHQVNKVTFTTGPAQDDGGWFTTTPRVQYRVDGQWKELIGQYDTPFVPGREGSGKTYTVAFPSVQADGVRLIGTAGGDHSYSSMAEISVSWVNAQLLQGDFEATGPLGEIWKKDATVGADIDRGCCARTGKQNAWIRTSELAGAQTISQTIAVTPGTKLRIEGWMRLSDGAKEVYLGARWKGGESIARLPRASDVYEYQKYSHDVTVPEGVTQIDVVAGYETTGTDEWVQIDDMSVTVL